MDGYPIECPCRYRVKGFWSYLKGDHGWGHIDRKGFAADLQPEVGMR